MFHHLSASVIIRHHARSGSGLERPTIVGKNGALNPCRERASEAVRCAHRARILLRLTATQRGAREVEAMSLRSLHAPRWVAVKRFACGRRPHWETGMAGSCNWRVRILFGVLVCLMSSARADQPEIAADRPPRHDRPSRKVVVGTTMTRWYSNYPGLDGRIEQMHGLIDQLAAESRAKYGRSIDVALFSEYAITAGKQGTAAEIAVLLDDKIIDAFAAKAREHNTHIVFGGVFFDRPGSSSCSNAAVVIDRQGRLVGRYDKVHPVLDRAGPEGQIVLEGGVRPGAEYNLFELDFGRVGVQICYDVEYPEGWRRLAEKGAELVLFPTQSPQLTRPGTYAATHEYWVVSSTFRNNASFFEPGTGLVAAQITEPKQTLVHEIDLSYLILPWSPRLRNGEAFRQAFGDRVGYRYSETEDRGIFWSNDPDTTIGQMARSLDLLETTAEQQARARDAQDRLRGGPAR
jgi:predicted amidohydrolase